MIVHVLKSGKQVKDIAGHKVKKSDAPSFYDLLNRVSQEKQNGAKKSAI